MRPLRLIGRRHPPQLQLTNWRSRVLGTTESTAARSHRWGSSAIPLVLPRGPGRPSRPTASESRPSPGGGRRGRTDVPRARPSATSWSSARSARSGPWPGQRRYTARSVGPHRPTPSRRGSICSSASPMTRLISGVASVSPSTWNTTMSPREYESSLGVNLSTSTCCPGYSVSIMDCCST